MHWTLSWLLQILFMLHKKGKLNTPWDNICAAFFTMLAWPLTFRVIRNERNTRSLEIGVQVVCNMINSPQSVSLEWFIIPILKIGLKWLRFACFEHTQAFNKYYKYCHQNFWHHPHIWYQISLTTKLLYLVIFVNVIYNVICNRMLFCVWTSPDEAICFMWYH